MAGRLVMQWLSAQYRDCPKCHGQYSREGWLCHCYQCCFEWDLRDGLADVLHRARLKHYGSPPAAPALPDTWGAPLPPVPGEGWPEMSGRAALGGDGSPLHVAE